MQHAFLFSLLSLGAFKDIKKDISKTEKTNI